MMYVTVGHTVTYIRALCFLAYMLNVVQKQSLNRTLQWTAF